MVKRILYIALVAMLGMSSCMKLVDDGFWNDMNELEQRIMELEQKCAKLNETAESLLAMAEVFQSYDYVKSYAPIFKDDIIVGYKIILEKEGELNLYNGTDGDDGRTPVVSLEQGDDGDYYWAVDGNLLKDADGSPIAITSFYIPVFKIENGDWYISVDNGLTWDKVGKATGNDGKTFVYSIKDNGNSITVELQGESMITIPKYIDIALTFSQNMLSLSAGQTAEISYNISGTLGEYELETIGEGGWCVDIVKNDNLSGQLKITAPDPLSDAKVSVFVGNEYNQMFVKTFLFTDGVCNNF